MDSDPDFAARPQLSEDVARYVRRRIFKRTFRAGEYLRLDQLAAESGISVTPVRESQLNLRAEGLLVQQPRRGSMVLAVTARDIGSSPLSRTAMSTSPGPRWPSTSPSAWRYGGTSRRAGCHHRGGAVVVQG